MTDSVQHRRYPRSGALQLLLGLITIGVLLLSLLLAISAYVAEGRGFDVQLSPEQAALLKISPQPTGVIDLSVGRDEAAELYSRISGYAAKDQTAWGGLAASLESKMQIRQVFTWYLWHGFFFSFGVLISVATLSLILTGLSGLAVKRKRKPSLQPAEPLAPPVAAGRSQRGVRVGG